jgi:hypothetical protein
MPHEAVDEGGGGVWAGQGNAIGLHLRHHAAQVLPVPLGLCLCTPPPIAHKASRTVNR